MLLALVMLALGLVLLAVAADQFVLGAARLSRALRIPAVVVGVVIVGFGTSLPEALVSGLAAGRGELAAGVGNIVGSNIANLTLLLGIGALMAPIAVGSTVVRREIPLVLLATGALAFVVQDTVSTLEGVLLFVGMLLIIAVTLHGALRGRTTDPLGPETDELVDTTHHHHRGRETLRTVLGLAGTIAAAQLTLEGALGLAAELGLAAGVVGTTIVAVGTSLPELVTVVQSSRRKEPDLIVGNLLGSNLFNALAVGGLIGMVGRGPIGDTAVTTTAVGAMLVATIAAAVMLTSGRRVSRFEGIALLALYAVTVVMLY